LEKGERMYDLTGKTFGRLTVISVNAKDLNVNKTLCLCKCECGNFKTVRASNLLYRHTTSCGCLRKESPSRVRHGMYGTRLYKIWENMKYRCHSPKCQRYKNYGARGIKVCDEWKEDFLNFYNWAITHGYNDTLTIDRIDVNGNYEPNNCRWATWEEQAKNKTTTKRKEQQ